MTVRKLTTPGDVYLALEGDAFPTTGVADGSFLQVYSADGVSIKEYIFDAVQAVWIPNKASGMTSLFTPSSYDTDMTMDGTAQSTALATGATRIRITNRGATTESIRLAFGTTAVEAESNLNISAAAATTGVYIGAVVDGYPGSEVFGVPVRATHFAIANTVALDEPIVSIEQGT